MIDHVVPEGFFIHIMEFYSHYQSSYLNHLIFWTQLRKKYHDFQMLYIHLNQFFSYF